MDELRKQVAQEETGQLTRNLASDLLIRLQEPSGFSAPHFDDVEQTVLVEALTRLAAGAPILPLGWRIVPEEPTEEMLKATIYSVATKQRHLESRVDLRPSIWRVMLEKSPTPPAAAEEKHDG